MRLPGEPRLQIMPDSLFVNGPSANGFDTGAFVSSQPGWLKDYREIIGDADRSGAEIVNIVATNFSISPRALLVLLEYQTGALSQPVPPAGDYPLGHVDENAKGLYLQLVCGGEHAECRLLRLADRQPDPAGAPGLQRRTPGSLADRRHGGIPVLFFPGLPGRRMRVPPGRMA